MCRLPALSFVHFEIELLLRFPGVILVITAVWVVDAVIEPRDPVTLMLAAEVSENEQFIVTVVSSSQKVGGTESMGS